MTYREKAAAELKGPIAPEDLFTIGEDSRPAIDRILEALARRAAAGEVAAAKELREYLKLSQIKKHLVTANKIGKTTEDQVADPSAAGDGGIGLMT